MYYAVLKEEGFKPNYYALVISIIKGYPVEKSLSCMGVSNYTSHRMTPEEKKNSYKDICVPSTVIKVATGISYRSIGRLLNVNYGTVQRAIIYYRDNYCESIRNAKEN